MKRSPLAVLLLLAAVVAVLAVFVYSPKRFAGEEGAVPLGPIAVDAAQPIDALAPKLDGAPPEPVTDAATVTEREAIDSPSAAGRTSLQLRSFTGRPVVGAQLLVARGETLLDQAMTDEQGEVNFAADGEPARLILAVEHRPLEERDVVLEPGRQEILLAEGGRLSGRFVLEDGACPGKVSLGIDSDSAFSSIAELPAAVESALLFRVLRKSYAIEETDEEGYFELTGLQETWSGSIRLRGNWKVVSTSHGLDVLFTWGVRLTEPISSLVVVIAPTPTLHGRLVLQDDGSPLAGVSLSMRLRSPDAEAPSISRTSTDDNGHFEFEREQERISSLDLHLGGSFDQCPSILELGGASIPADGDLGEVLVDEVRHVPFQLQDPEGNPVAKGQAIAAGTRSDRTGQDGRGELRWIARSVDSMFVEAEGFVPAEVELPPVIAGPILITLMHANELVVILKLPEGADTTQFKVMLSGEERITALPITEFGRQSAHVSPWDSLAHYSARGAAPDTYLSARQRTEERNRASFKALRPGVEIELQVHGITGNMVYYSETLAPMGPTERREVEVPLEEGMIVFRGRVLDKDGNPLARAHLQLGGQILGWADEEGRFLCFLSGPETGTLLVQHSACTTKYLHDYAIPTHGKPVEFRLNPARQVIVEVVDESGAPVPQPELWREYGGFTSNTHRIEGNRHLAPSVPEETFVFMVRLAGRVYRQEHDPSVPEARFVVPVHGSLVALVSETTTANRHGSFRLLLIPPEGDPGQPLVESRESAANLSIEVPAVFPGTYQVSLNYTPSEEELAAGRAKETSARVSVTVEPGRQSEVRLALAADGS